MMLSVCVLDYSNVILHYGKMIARISVTLKALKSDWFSLILKIH